MASLRSINTIIIVIISSEHGQPPLAKLKTRRDDLETSTACVSIADLQSAHSSVQP